MEKTYMVKKRIIEPKKKVASLKELAQRLDEIDERRERAKKLYRASDFRISTIEEKIKRLEKAVLEKLGIDLREEFVKDYPSILNGENEND